MGVYVLGKSVQCASREIIVKRVLSKYNEISQVRYQIETLLSRKRKAMVLQTLDCDYSVFWNVMCFVRS